MSNTHGGVRKGSGRKPISYEKEIRDSIEKALGKMGKSMTDLWDATLKEALKGSIAHQNTVLNYYFGKPKEHIDITSADEQLPAPQIIIGENKTK